MPGAPTPAGAVTGLRPPSELADPPHRRRRPAPRRRRATPAHAVGPCADSGLSRRRSTPFRPATAQIRPDPVGSVAFASCIPRPMTAAPRCSPTRCSHAKPTNDGHRRPCSTPWPPGSTWTLPPRRAVCRGSPPIAGTPPKTTGWPQPWAGLVWCNPPFSHAGPWADRFVEHGDGVILFPCSVNASWLFRLLRAVPAVLMLEHLRFVHPTHTGRHVPVGIALAGLGVGAAAVTRAADRLPGVLLTPTR